MVHVIDGKRAAAALLDDVIAAAKTLEAETGVKPSLAVVIVGEDPASHVYVNAKTKTANECGFNSIQRTLPEQWAAAGFIDTLLRWKMKLEVGHGNEKAIQPGIQA